MRVDAAGRFAAGILAELATRQDRSTLQRGVDCPWVSSSTVCSAADGRSRPHSGSSVYPKAAMHWRESERRNRPRDGGCSRQQRKRDGLEPRQSATKTRSCRNQLDPDPQRIKLFKQPVNRCKVQRMHTDSSRPLHVVQTIVDENRLARRESSPSASRCCRTARGGNPSGTGDPSGSLNAPARTGLSVGNFKQRRLVGGWPEPTHTRHWRFSGPVTDVP